jgi:hypothetical protein
MLFIARNIAKVHHIKFYSTVTTLQGLTDQIHGHLDDLCESDNLFNAAKVNLVSFETYKGIAPRPLYEDRLIQVARLNIGKLCIVHCAMCNRS